jgi:hypothetical protein
MRSLFLSAMILIVGSTFAKAEKPRQAPPAMTEQEIKDYIDAQVDKAVKERMPLAFSARAGNPDPRFIYPKAVANPWNPVVHPFPPVGSSAPMTVMACPAGTSCPDGCVDNGDGTCSCPAGTSCGMSQYGATAYADDDGGGGASGSCGKNGSGRHLLGRIFGRRRNK